MKIKMQTFWWIDKFRRWKHMFSEANGEGRCPGDKQRFFDGAKCIDDTCPIAICRREIFRKVLQRGNDISSNGDDRCETGHQEYTSLVIEPSNRVARYYSGKHIDTRRQGTISRYRNINTEYYVSFDCKRAYK